MKTMKQYQRTLYAVVLAGAIAGGAGATAATVAAQDFTDLKIDKPPLVLKAQGSFYEGGELVKRTATESGQTGDGHYFINQMHVRFMMPQDGKKLPVVMVHGASLSSKNWDTQPDGRMGWSEYFVRKGHPVYVADQVGRALSGFDIAQYMNVRAGLVPPSTLPRMFKLTKEAAWGAFRLGPKFGVPYPDGQVRMDAVDELVKQAVPDPTEGVPNPNPSYKILAGLAVKLQGAVLIGHSQGGGFPLEAALVNPKGVRGLVLMEPGGCRAKNLTDTQIASLINLPILAVFGDHLDTDTGIPGFSWQNSFEDCQAFVTRMNAAGGNARMLHPPALGIFGNTHMLMNDKNSDQIADLVLKWIDRTVEAKDRGNPWGDVVLKKK